MEGIQLTISKRDQHSKIYADHARLKRRHKLLIYLVARGFTSQHLKLMEPVEWQLLSGAVGTSGPGTDSIQELITDMEDIELLRDSVPSALYYLCAAGNSEAEQMRKVETNQ